MCRSCVGREAILSTSMKGRILPYMRFVFLPISFIYSTISISMAWIFILWVIAQCYSIHFLLKLSPHCPWGVLSVSSCVYWTLLHGRSCFVFFFRTSLLPSTVRCSRVMLYTRHSQFSTEFWCLLLKIVFFLPLFKNYPFIPLSPNSSIVTFTLGIQCSPPDSLPSP